MKRGEWQPSCQSNMIKEEFIVDRIEGEYIVLETSEGMLNLEKHQIIGDAKEGSILVKENNKYIVDIKKTEERRNRIRNLMKGVWE